MAVIAPGTPVPDFVLKREDGSAFNVPEGQVWVQLVPLEAQVAIT